MKLRFSTVRFPEPLASRAKHPSYVCYSAKGPSSGRPIGHVVWRGGQYLLTGIGIAPAAMSFTAERLREIADFLDELNGVEL